MKVTHFGQKIGIRIVSAKKGFCETELIVRKEHLNSLGVVHGGVLTTMADIAMGHACRSVSDKKLVTVELKLSFMRPIFPARIRAEGKVLKKGEHLIFASCSIFSAEGLEAVVALGTYMMVDDVKK
ncbi:MAG: PaaI family thioesterase [Conexivisphaerales archaeon]